MQEKLDQIKSIIEELKNNTHLNVASGFITEMGNGNNPVWLRTQGGLAQGQINERLQLEQEKFTEIENLMSEIESNI